MSPPGDSQPRSALWIYATPALFVVLWSTGFIGAKLGLPYVEPMTFLALRFALASGLLLLLVMAMGAPWPDNWSEVGHIAFAGFLLHAVYLGCIFAAIDLKVEAGVAAVIVALQPLLTAVAARPFLGEKTSGRQWIGLLLGLTGVTLVVWHKLGLGLGTPFGMALCFLSLIGLVGATLYQKRFCAEMPFRSGNVIQLATAGLATGLAAAIFETRVIVWTPEFVFALGWLVLVLSLGAFMLFFVLLRHGAAARVSSLFFLVPPSTALIAWFLFDERFDQVALGGMALTVIGVALANLPAKTPATPKPG